MGDDKKSVKVKRRKKFHLGQFILGLILGLISIITFLPLLLIFIVSFTDNKYIMKHGYGYFPKKWSLKGYDYVLSYGIQLVRSYGVTIIVTLVGTLLGLLVMSLFAYSLSRKSFRLRGFLAIFMLIPMIFNGGQLSGYIVFTTMYHLKDSLWVLILPPMIQTMYLIILRTYISTSIPESILESAKIDGAGEYYIFYKLILPLMKPVLASVGFMVATAYWNDWYNALLYITKGSKTPLQLLLIRIRDSIDFLLHNTKVTGAALTSLQKNLPKDSATMAIVITVIGPIVIAYPFFQKYIIKGMTVGSVKG